MGLKSSRFGPFLGCSNYPERRHTRPLSVAEDGEAAESGDRELGVDPVTGETVWLKAGRFGPYIQLGEPKDYGLDLEQVRASAGISVQRLAPLGPFRFSYAVPL